MPVNYDPSANSEVEKDAQWGRPILDGKYLGRITWVQDPSQRKDKDSGQWVDEPGTAKITFTVVSTRERTPDGAVKLDYYLNSTNAKHYMEALGYDTSKKGQLDARKDKGKTCVLVIATNEGNQKSYIKKLLPADGEQPQTQQAASKPAKAQAQPKDENPFA